MRLIDANDYRKRRCRTCINRVQCDNGGNLCFDIMVLNTCPTIEAEPVKHAQWIIDYAEGTKIYHAHCSECGKEPNNHIGGDYYIDKLSDFCPNCGARMDGDSDD